LPSGAPLIQSPTLPACTYLQANGLHCHAAYCAKHSKPFCSAPPESKPAPACTYLQAVGQRQKESLLARLAESDKQLAAAAKERQQLEAQLTRAVEQVQARSQAAADAQEKTSRQMAVLRQVCVTCCNSVFS
jgi:hypothetical protein